MGKPPGEASSEMRDGPWVLRALRPPVYPDPRKTSAARLNHWMALTNLAANVLSLLALIALQPSHAERFVTLIAAIVAVTVASFTLNRTGRQTAAAWLLIVGLWVVGTAAAWTAGGSRTPPSRASSCWSRRAV